MKFDDIKTLATSSLLFSLEKIITPKIIKILYLLGLVTIALKALSHLFATFSHSFGAGLWGLIEIAVFSLLAFVILRIICETVIVYFKSNADSLDEDSNIKPSKSLIEDVNDAILELATDEEEKTPPVKEATAASPTRKKPVKRTAKRTPRKKTDK